MSMMDPEVENITEEILDTELDEALGASDEESNELGEAMEASDVESDELDSFESEAVEELEEIDDTQVISILESVLFATDKPQGLGVFKQIFKGTNVDTSKIKKQLESLKIEYAGGNRGVTLEETTGGYQLRTKSDNMVFIKRMVKGRSFRLSGPALEVLSIVAYKQPCIKSQVDEIRGVESGHILRGLMDRGMVNFAGKSELPGKPMMYGTSRKFLEIFGLRNLNELPSLSEIDELLPEGIEDEHEKNETLDQLSTQLSKEAITSYSESEEELGKITDQLSEISSSTDFFEQEKVRQKKERDAMRAQDLEDALTVGEEISNKDSKWLEKYKLALAAEALNEEQTSEEQVVEGTGEEVEVDASVLAEPTTSEEEVIATVDFQMNENFIEEPLEVAAKDENNTAVAEVLEEPLVTEDEVIYVSEEIELDEALETKPEEAEASKIGQVDVSSLKDDLDFLG